MTGSIAMPRSNGLGRGAVAVEHVAHAAHLGGQAGGELVELLGRQPGAMSAQPFGRCLDAEERGSEVVIVLGPAVQQLGRVEMGGRHHAAHQRATTKPRPSTT